MQNIFKIINDNILALAEDMNEMHRKVDEIHNAFFQSESNIKEMPKVGGDTPQKL